jgi:phage FluMu protein Com
LEYKCPRCDGTDYYSSREQVSGGAVGGIINNPNGPDFGVMRPISYDVNVYRCKSCNTEMDEYISTLFHNWKESWRNIGYSIFMFFLCVLGFDIILPWLIEY